MLASKYVETNLGVEKYREKYSNIDAIECITIALKV